MYRLEESSPNTINNSMSSWAHKGLCAKIEFLSKEEMGGGLRRALKVQLVCVCGHYCLVSSLHVTEMELNIKKYWFVAFVVVALLYNNVFLGRTINYNYCIVL